MTSEVRMIPVYVSSQPHPSMQQEMASEERKAENSKIKEENLFASYGAAEQEAETDAFQCGRCKQVRAYCVL